MKTTECPFCMEEIKEKAKICKHCHQTVYKSRQELIMDSVLERMQIVLNAPSTISKPSVSACGALCYAKLSGGGHLLDECLGDCRIASAIAIIAEKLQRELVISFAEIIWGGGDIDPLPLEKSVRERFSKYGIN